MKAFHILIFLLIFNMFFWTVTVGLGIYNVDYSGNEGFDLSGKNSNNIGYGILAVASITGNHLLDIGGFVTLLVIAAAVGWVVSQASVQGLVLGTFTWFFWSSFINSMSLLYNISNANIGVSYVIIIFGMIAGAIFAAGLFQLATQGWRNFI